MTQTHVGTAHETDLEPPRGTISADARDGIHRTRMTEVEPAPTRVAGWSTALRRAAVPLFLLTTDVLAFGGAALAVQRSVDANLLLWGIATVVLLAAGGAYRIRLTFSVLADLPLLGGRVLAAAATVRALSGPEVGALPSFEGSSLRADLLLTVVLLTFVVLGRAVTHGFIRRMRRRRTVAHPTLVIGAGVVGGRIARVLSDHPEFGLRPVGFLDDHPKLAETDRPVPVIGEVNDLTDVVPRLGVDRVIIAFTQSREADVVDIIRTCHRLDCEIFLVPRLFELSTKEHEMEEVLGFPLVRLRRAAYRTVGWRLKRVLDLFVSASALVLLAVPMLAIASALRLSQGPGVIFRQERIGVDGRTFLLFKFRSLKPSDETESATMWNIRHDGRVSPLGRFLRRSSLDELPQLINILRGDMSLVGPRPERPHFVDEFAALFPRYPARHRVPCGLTGWAQIHGLRGDTSIEERARFDNYYIENWSPWLDVRIILRTAVSVFKAAG